MALIAKNLTSRQLAPGIRKAEYFHATDAQAAIRAANYFNDAYQALPKGTIIDVLAATDTTPVLCRYVVTASASNGVTLALQTVV